MTKRMRFHNALLGALGACAFGADLSKSQPHSRGAEFAGECVQQECNNENAFDVQSLLGIQYRLHPLIHNGVVGHPRLKAPKVGAKETLHQEPENDQTAEASSLAEEQGRKQTWDASRQIHLESTGENKTSDETVNETTSFVLQPQQDRCGTASCELKFGTAGETERDFRQLAKTPAMRFTKVCTQGGQVLDFRMSAASEYKASNDANNGIVGNFARINIRSGSSLKLRFEFFKSGTNTKVNVNSVIFSIVDLDSSGDAEPKVTVGGHSRYVLSKLSTLHTKMNKGTLQIGATEKQKGNEGSPVRPNQMTEEQQRRAIALKFSKVKEFFVTFEVKSSSLDGGYDFLFAGRCDACLLQPRIDHAGADVKHGQKVEKQPVVNIDGKFPDKAQLGTIMTSSPTPAEWVWWNAADFGVIGMAATESRQKDVPHWKAILRSKPFEATHQTMIAVTLNGGVGAKRSVNGQKAELAGITDEQGFLGVAIQDVSTNRWVLSKTKTARNKNNEKVVFSKNELEPYIGRPLTVDFIDSYSGPWGWITFKWLAITGTSTPVPTPGPSSTPNSQSDPHVKYSNSFILSPAQCVLGLVILLTS